MKKSLLRWENDGREETKKRKKERKRDQTPVNYRTEKVRSTIKVDELDILHHHGINNQKRQNEKKRQKIINRMGTMKKTTTIRESRMKWNTWRR